MDGNAFKIISESKNIRKSSIFSYLCLRNTSKHISFGFLQFCHQIYEKSTFDKGCSACRKFRKFEIQCKNCPREKLKKFRNSGFFEKTSNVIYFRILNQSFKFVINFRNYYIITLGLEICYFFTKRHERVFFSRS